MSRRYHETTQMLARDFTRAFIKALWSVKDMQLSKLYGHVIRSGAPRWYVSHANALRVLSTAERNCRLADRKNGLYVHLKAAVEKIMKENRGVSLSDAVAMVIESPAPSFFISERTARRIISRRKQHSFT